MGKEMFALLTQFTVPVINTPGQLGKITDLLLKEKINISGIEAHVTGNVSFVRLTTTETPSKVNGILAGAKYAPIQTPVASVTIPNTPGELNKLTKFLVEQGLNITGVYGTTPVGAPTTTLLLSIEATDGSPIDYPGVFNKYFNTVAVAA